MEILIISGFLGAGKTTFIKTLSKKVDEKFVIVENEFGDSNVDAQILKDDVNPDIKIWELTEGCICCSVKTNFSASVLTIANVLNPDYLIVEPSGVGKLVNVINELQQIEYDRIKILKPVTIIDFLNYNNSRQAYPDIYNSQVEGAGTILFSKTENASNEELQQIKSSLQKLNPKADIIINHYTNQPQEWWKSLLKYYVNEKYNEEKKNTGKGFDEDKMSQITFNDVKFDTIDDLINLLEGLIYNKYGNIFRAKGYVRIDKEIVRVELVGAKYSIYGAQETDQCNFVVIGNKLNNELLLRLFK